MDMLAGTKVVTKECQKHSAAHYLKPARIVIYYFSASWVDDAKLLQLLKSIYEENVKRGTGMEVIYVSFDTDEKLFSKQFKIGHGPWPAIPFRSVVVDQLRWRYDITCLPQIVVVKKHDGYIITRRGKEELEKIGINVLVSWTDYCDEDYKSVN